MFYCGSLCMQLCSLSFSVLMPMALFLMTLGVAKAQEVITVYGAETVFQHAGVPTDTPNLIRLAPGGAVSRNGPLTSIPHYRGLHTYRVQTHLDGRQPHTAGPVWMDSPLHYMPSSLIESVKVHRGIAPVRAGSAIGGYIDAVSHTSEFGFGEDFTFHGRMTADNQSVNSANTYSAFLATSNEDTRLHVYGVHDEADEMESAEARIATSQFERDFFGIGGGHQWQDGEWSLDVARNNTGDTGTPALPMDIIFYHTDLVNFRAKQEMGEWNIKAQLHYQDTDHDMSNYHMRPAPDFSQANILPPFRGTDRRRVEVFGESIGGKLMGQRVWGGGDLHVGVDFRQNENSAIIYDPDAPPFFVQNFKDAETDEYGVFAEWNGVLGGDWRGEFGLRVQHTKADAAPVSHFRPTCQLLLNANANSMHPRYGPNGPLAARGCNDPTLTPADWMPPPAMSVGQLSGRYNQSDRSKDETEVDVTMVLHYDWSDTMQLEFGVARKTRAPSYIERYLWVPLESNSGRADGNNYVGNVDLDPEDSLQVELGLNWQQGGWRFSPRVFARRVDDYITGVPTNDEHVIRVSGVLNGDPTPVMFANVDAEFYGADAIFHVPVTADWQVDGTVSYVRGKLRESFLSHRRADQSTRLIRDDNIYRMPPLRGLLSLSRAVEDWIVVLELDWAARQSKLSQLMLDDPLSGLNHNRPTSGYVLYNLRAQYTHPSMGFRLSAGVENLTDRSYVDHMNGFNRVGDSDIPVGERLPGPGRNAYARVRWEW